MTVFAPYGMTADWTDMKNVLTQADMEATFT